MGDLYFCMEQRLVRVDGQVVELTAKEFDILALLITHPQRVFTYELIMELVWNEDVTFYSRKAVSNHMSNLRKKLKKDFTSLVVLFCLCPFSREQIPFVIVLIRILPLAITLLTIVTEVAIMYLFNKYII